jgi:hypothetical protein
VSRTSGEKEIRHASIVTPAGLREASAKGKGKEELGASKQITIEEGTTLLRMHRSCPGQKICPAVPTAIDTHENER